MPTAFTQSPAHCLSSAASKSDRLAIRIAAVLGEAELAGETFSTGASSADLQKITARDFVFASAAHWDQLKSRSADKQKFFERMAKRVTRSGFPISPTTARKYLTAALSSPTATTDFSIMQTENLSHSSTNSGVGVSATSIADGDLSAILSAQFDHLLESGATNVTAKALVEATVTEIAVLRKYRRWTWEQIATNVFGAVDLPIKPNTLRAYFNEQQGKIDKQKQTDIESALKARDAEKRKSGLAVSRAVTLRHSTAASVQSVQGVAIVTPSRAASSLPASQAAKPPATFQGVAPMTATAPVPPVETGPKENLASAPVAAIPEGVNDAELFALIRQTMLEESSLADPPMRLEVRLPSGRSKSFAVSPTLRAAVLNKQIHTLQQFNAMRTTR
ncbi:hypothetical protein BX589_10155 [Paraburkholderia fungorum]|uniref:hypothetical protein n=1 Tax=Paraburkholderia fungorum TaxID=134537 RepID=UPI000D06B4E3|nr:hypothetical protein [Paraburkholderia fungorum]PRZ56405.1 hypothetical protein BX589_10155 [Paraburkholderia fungorum]